MLCESMKPWVSAKPVNPSQTHNPYPPKPITCRCRYGFSQVQVWVAKKNPRVTHEEL